MLFRLLRLSLLVLMAASCADDCLAQRPVFVRMKDQLFSRGGDYEAFAQKRRGESRRKLRQEVITALKSKADKSWAAIGTFVGDLECEDVQRYWIVNGFAARVTADAKSKLSAHPQVEFVYDIPSRLVAPLHARPARAARVGWEAVFRKTMSRWKDDAQEPVSIDGLKVPWNLSRIKADKAWQEKATGQGVVVALMDSGLMMCPSLEAALWRNADEVLDGRDTDGNGYVDDMFGYDFRTGNAHVLGDGPQMTHGSMCGGIIAGRPKNKLKLITGVAPRSRLMVIRGMGALLGYEYALQNGADVLSMSFMWVRGDLGDYRGLYRLAHEHLAAGGVVSVGGAGNFRQNRPAGKQIALPKDIPCVIAAAGIVQSGEQPSFSSAGPVYWNGVRFYDDYGPKTPLRKPDVTGCIGGFPVWGRPAALRRRRSWKVVSEEGENFALVRGPRGNSFSGPHAAGVAALMLSVNPDLNVWEIKQLMEQTCTDLGDKGWDTDYGHGLLDAVAAVRAARAASGR